MKLDKQASLALVAGLIIVAVAVVGVVTYVLFFSFPAEPPCCDDPPTNNATLQLGIQNGNGIAYYDVWIDDEKASRGVTLWPAEFYQYNFTLELENCTGFDVTVKVYISGVLSHEDSTIITLCDEDERTVIYWAITREFRE